MKRFLMTSLVFVVVLSPSCRSGGQQSPQFVMDGCALLGSGEPLQTTSTCSWPQGRMRLELAPLYESLFFVSVLIGDTTPVLAVSYEWKDNLTPL